jgi:Zn-dependent peptidase ImmA (M78 family)
MLSKETRLALRRARRLQAVAAELMQVLERPAYPVLGQASSDDDSEEVASKERARFGVSSSRREWKKSSEALWGWRDLLERANILTFQMQVPLEDSRGFSLAEREPYVVVVSSEDSEYARIFTLFHEYGHFMMRSSGICIPRGEKEPSGQSNKTERWCDHFAGAFLMPRDELRQDEDCKTFLLEVPRKETRLWRLSRRYTASRLAVLTRLRVLEWLSRERYAREVGALGVSTTKRGGRSEYANRPIARNGRAFTSLLFQALEQNVVGYNEMADYLGIRLKHVERIRDLLSV